MSNNFHNWGAFQERVNKAKLLNPKIAARYEEVREEIAEKERIYSETYPIMLRTTDPAIADAAWQFRLTNIKPLDREHGKLWNQMFCKHKHTHVEGGFHYGSIDDDVKEFCNDCGLEVGYARV